MKYKQRKNRKEGVDPSKKSASKTSLSGRKRAVRWFLGLAAVVITTFVTASATNLGNVTSNFIGDLFSSTGPPARIDLFHIVHTGKKGESHAFANAFVLSEKELSQLNSLNQTDPSYETWFASRQAVDVNATSVELVVEGNRNHTVRITNIHPIVSCQPPLNGTLFESPSLGADPIAELFFDLDNPRAPPSFLTEDQNVITSHEDFFGTHTVSLKQGEQFTFKMSFSTTKHFCKFTLVMTVLDGDKVVTEPVTNNGQPFQVTADLYDYTSRHPLHLYHVLYIRGGSLFGKTAHYNSFGDLMWDRVDPNTNEPL